MRHIKIFSERRRPVVDRDASRLRCRARRGIGVAGLVSNCRTGCPALLHSLPLSMTESARVDLQGEAGLPPVFPLHAKSAFDVNAAPFANWRRLRCLPQRSPYSVYILFSPVCFCALIAAMLNLQTGVPFVV